MGILKPESEYGRRGPDFKPGPRNGHLSEPHPDYQSAYYGPIHTPAYQVWEADLSAAEVKRIMTSVPPPVCPAGCPEPGRDFAISHTTFPARDGHPVELKIWKPVKAIGDAAATTLVLRMHGGGWIVGNHETEEPEARYVAALPNVVVVSVDYRMAPEHPFPYPVNDSFDALKWCKLHAADLGVNPEHIIVAGSSAGSNLAAIVTILARNEGITGIVAQSLTIPATCHPKFFDRVPNKDRYELLSYAQNADALVLNARLMDFFWDIYITDDPQPDVRHSPLLEPDLTGLPPASFHVAGLDPLRDEGIAYAQALEAAGVPVELHTYKGLPHSFVSAPTVPESVVYYERVIAFTKKWAAKASKS